MIPNDDLGYGPFVEAPGVLVLTAPDPADHRLERNEVRAFEEVARAIRGLECGTCSVKLLLEHGAYAVAHENACLTDRIGRRAFGRALTRNGSLRSREVGLFVPKAGKRGKLGRRLSADADKLLRIMVAIDGLHIDPLDSTWTETLARMLPRNLRMQPAATLDTFQDEAKNALIAAVISPHISRHVRDLDIRELTCEALRRGLRLQVDRDRLCVLPHFQNEPLLLQLLRERERDVVTYLGFQRFPVLDAFAEDVRDATARYFLRHDDDPLRSFEKLIVTTQES